MAMGSYSSVHARFVLEVEVDRCFFFLKLKEELEKVVRDDVNFPLTMSM